ncbi:hypothetical protein Tco_0882413 [Tanacetum coccineum]
MLKRLFSPPKLDLSNSGLEEFQQPEFEGYGPKTSKEKHVSVRRECSAPIIEDWESDSDEEDEPKFKGKGVNTARPKAVLKAVRGQAQVNNGLGPQEKLIFLSSVQGNPIVLQEQRVTKTPQSSKPSNLVVFGAVYEEMYDSLERAATTATSLEAAQDSSNINRT